MKKSPLLSPTTLPIHQSSLYCLSYSKVPCHYNNLYTHSVDMLIDLTSLK